MINIEFLRQFRFGKYAIFDFLISFLGFYLLSPKLSALFLKFKIYVPRYNWLFLVLPFSIFVHLIFGRLTPLTKDFLDLNGNYILKIIIIISLYFGLKGIHTIK